MDQSSTKINCPNCGHEIDVNELLYHQLEDEVHKKYEDKLAKEKQKYEEQSKALKDDREKLEKEKEALQESVDSGVKKALKDEKKKIEYELRGKALEEELNAKSKQVKELNKAKSEIEKLKREKDELKEAIEAEAEKKLNQTITEEKDKIRKNEEEKVQLKLSEKEHIITQLQEQLKEAQRKAAQGSMQLQGEVQELAIEDWLASNFPLDTIEGVKKGVRGADCLHIVNTRTRQNCGSIYYESKRAKGFQPTWIEKFKNDIRDKGANIGVLVTETMPSDMNRMGLKEGVWICTFDEFKGLCVVLRQSLIQISNAISSQENKGDKMTMIYDYLTSNEFKLQIEAIVEGFTQMKIDLDSEKRSMQNIWKKREKQIEKVLLNTNHMYSSIKGIAGSAIQPIKQLELPSDDEEPNEENT
ncbi:MAG: DUF2130 domain-containing protein [Promethearchaeota archaeon]|jgi:hypothetical protein